MNRVAIVVLAVLVVVAAVAGLWPCSSSTTSSTHSQSSESEPAFTCSVYFVLVVLMPPTEGRTVGSYWGGVQPVLDASVPSLESVLATQLGSCVDYVVSHKDMVGMVPESVASNPRVAVHVAEVDPTECWVTQLVTAQAYALELHPGGNVVMFEADQFYLRDLTHLFRMQDFDFAFTLTELRGGINSGVMFVKGVTERTVTWWRTYHDKTRELMRSKEIGKCLSGINQRVLWRDVVEGQEWDEWYVARTFPDGSRIMQLPMSVYNVAFSGFGPGGMCDLSPYLSATLIHAKGTSKFVPVRCATQLQQLLKDVHDNYHGPQPTDGTAVV